MNEWILYSRLRVPYQNAMQLLKKFNIAKPGMDCSRQRTAGIHSYYFFRTTWSGESANAVPHYQKLCNRDSHIWGIRNSLSAMAEPRYGWTTFSSWYPPCQVSMSCTRSGGLNGAQACSRGKRLQSIQKCLDFNKHCRPPVTRWRIWNLPYPFSLNLPHNLLIPMCLL